MALRAESSPDRGWHFRNADNTAPNDGSVNAPQELRQFIFSPVVGRGADYGGSATGTEDVEAVRSYGTGWLLIEAYRLTPPAAGDRAGFEFLEFAACLTWPTARGPVEPSDGPSFASGTRSLPSPRCGAWELRLPVPAAARRMLGGANAALKTMIERIGEMDARTVAMLGEFPKTDPLGNLPSSSGHEGSAWRAFGLPAANRTMRREEGPS